MEIWPWARVVLWVGVVLLVGSVKMKRTSKAHDQTIVTKSSQPIRRQNNIYKHSKEHFVRHYKVKTLKRRSHFESRSDRKPDVARKLITTSFDTGDESIGQFPGYLRQARKNYIYQQRKTIPHQPNASKLRGSWNSNASEETEDGLIKRSRNRVRLKSQRSHLRNMSSSLAAKLNVLDESAHRFVPNETKRQQISEGIPNTDRPIELFNGNTQGISDDATRLVENPDSFFANPMEANPRIRALKPSHFYAPAVHRFIPAEHRYPSPPIHRYLSSPVLFKGTNGESNPVVGSKEVAVRNKGISGTDKQYGGGPRPFYQGPPHHGPHIIIVNRPFHSPVPVPVPGPPRIVLLHRPVPIPPQGFPDPVMLHGPRPPPLFVDNQREFSGPVIDPCGANPCRNGGTCTAVINEFRCICPVGYKGDKCEVQSRCTPNPCKNFGKCTELPDDYECTCHSGFHGKSCDLESRCEPNPCRNGGVCTENVGTYICSCMAGFMGKNCERESKCLPINPCKNGGVCNEDLGGYKCNCKDGNSGINCEVRETSTACDNYPCHNGATCIANIYDSSKYSCYCASGYTGLGCDEEACDNCPSPWTCNQGVCKANYDPPEKTFPSVAISSLACGPINPCLFGGHCIPEEEEYTCICPRDRKGSRCEHLIQESSCNGCHHHAVCIYSKCSCRPGYTGDGKTCRPKASFCHPNPCLNGGSCYEEETTDPNKSNWWCECTKGYNGKRCHEYDPCSDFKCHNGGRCESTNNVPQCKCESPYEGTNCLLDNGCKPKDGVNRNPCKNGGKCDFENGELKCSCPIPYEGPTCSENKCDKCDKKHAFCDKGICKCKPPYTGDGITCKEPPARAPPTRPTELANSCDPNKCLNGATCIEGKGTFFCACPQNTYGRLCEKKTIPTTAPPKAVCHPNPCLNGGICKETGVNQDFDCICPNPRFKGRFCDVDMCAECDPHARCINGKCYCRRGFTGDGYSCKKVKPKCPEYSTVVSSDICICNPGYYMNNAGKRTCIPTENSVRGLSTTQHGSKLELPLPMDSSETKSGQQWSEDIIVTEYRNLGCWADTPEWRDPSKRSMMVMEGLDPLLAGRYQERKQPISNCAEVAKRLGFRVFAIQNGGQCFGGADEVTYKAYGPSDKCADGVGGPLANDVYKL